MAGLEDTTKSTALALDAHVLRESQDVLAIWAHGCIDVVSFRAYRTVVVARLALRCTYLFLQETHMPTMLQSGNIRTRRDASVSTHGQSYATERNLLILLSVREIASNLLLSWAHPLQCSLRPTVSTLCLLLTAPLCIIKPEGRGTFAGIPVVSPRTMRTSLVFLFTLSLAAAKRSGMLVHERRDSVPAGFIRVGPAPDDQLLSLRLGLAQGDIAGLESRLLSVSSPSSPEYRQWLSKEEVESFVAPKPETTNLIRSFLAENDIPHKALTPTGDALSVSITVAQANELFDTSFDMFNHTESGKVLVRTLAYSIPAALKGHLEFVHPTTTFAPVIKAQPISTVPAPESLKARDSNAKHAARATPPASCQTAIVPSCVETLYNIPTAPVSPPANFTLGLAGYISGTSPTDVADTPSLQLFLAAERPSVPSSLTFQVQSLDGQHSSPSSILANLATQWTVGLAAFASVIQYSVGLNIQDGLFGYLDLADLVLAQAVPPNVFIASLGDSIMEERDVSTPLYTNLCNAYMQLGARGVSVIASAGDGSFQTLGGFFSPTCTPLFPTGCPYVTSVGATTGIPETGAPFSSGGFSNVFSRPNFQSTAVLDYVITQGSSFPFSSVNLNGRAYPDVAAVGGNILAIWSNQGWLVDGVAASTPIFGSIVSLLNAALVKAGKPTLGYLNPFLYSTGASALNDITTGSFTFSVCGVSGFSAAKGWDPVTGLGTPNFTALLSAIGL